MQNVRGGQMQSSRRWRKCKAGATEKVKQLLLAEMQKPARKWLWKQTKMRALEHCLEEAPPAGGGSSALGHSLEARRRPDSSPRTCCCTQVLDLLSTAPPGERACRHANADPPPHRRTTATITAPDEHRVRRSDEVN